VSVSLAPLSVSRWQKTDPSALPCTPHSGNSATGHPWPLKLRLQRAPPRTERGGWKHRPLADVKPLAMTAREKRTRPDPVARPCRPPNLS